MNFALSLVLGVALCCTLALSFDHRRRSKRDGTMISPSQICKYIPGLIRSQQRFCRRRPWLMTSLQTGLRQARTECKTRFSGANVRWNCSTSNEASVFAPILRSSSREAAFAWGISAAGIVVAVAHDCSNGLLGRCGCQQADDSNAPPLESEVKQEQLLLEWTDCDDDIKAGMKYSRDFLVASMKGNSKTNIVQEHNANVGRRIVRQLIKENCKCHGTSGSCAIKSCWKKVPPMSAVGLALEASYRNATRVEVVQKTDAIYDFVPINSRARFSKDDFIYEDESPTYCEADPRAFSLGTAGRDCNVTETGSGGCSFLCCGRGYKAITDVVNDRCNCHFAFCCSVACKRCIRMTERHVCQ